MKNIYSKIVISKFCKISLQDLVSKFLEIISYIFHKNLISSLSFSINRHAFSLPFSFFFSSFFVSVLPE